MRYISKYSTLFSRVLLNLNFSFIFLFFLLFNLFWGIFHFWSFPLSMWLFVLGVFGLLFLF
jgi:hypothetical protein